MFSVQYLVLKQAVHIEATGLEGESFGRIPYEHEAIFCWFLFEWESYVLCSFHAFEVCILLRFQTNGSTHRGEIRQSGGGVGRNIADALGKLGAHPFLISAIGNDQTGNYLLKNTLKHVVSIINELLQVIPVTGKQLMHTGIVKSDICRCIVYFYLEDKPKRENTNKYDLRKKIRQVQHLYDTYSQYFFITEYLWATPNWADC